LNVQVGDYVVAAECRQISKSVSFVVVEVKSLCHREEAVENLPKEL